MDSRKMSKSNWHTESPEEIAAQFSSSLDQGLSSEDAEKRLNELGQNTLTEEKEESFWHEFIEGLREPMVLMLIVTGILYAIWGELSDAITIFVIILTLNTVEVVNEQRSKKAIASLRKLAEPSTSVFRDGHFQEIPVDQVVPGDLIFLPDGHRVPADARLVDAYGLSVDESALTGESLPVEKNTHRLTNPETPLAERHNMVFSSTLITRGKGKAIVVATGMNTEIGQIAGMARQVREPRTPLQNMMDELSRVLIWFALGFSVLVPLVGIFLAHQPVKQMLLTGLSLAYATIPEELPIIITMVLSLGAFRLSKKHAVARRLKGVESLGSVTVIATDKTGTLTENRMQVVRFEPAEAESHLLEIGVFCNDATSNENGFSGDAVDVALIQAARKFGLNIKSERKNRPILNEFTFDNERKRMSTLSMRGNQAWVAVKGAPESILAQCSVWQHPDSQEPMNDDIRRSILDQVSLMAGDGLRVLAFAERYLPEPNASQDTAESELTFIGLIGLQDPPRPEVRSAVATCQNAGVRVIMITGDHPLTASAIGKQVGLNGKSSVITGPELDQLTKEEFNEAVKNTSIFARATPEHKLRIVQALQDLGERVAVTGDGVNDAPALSAADIGVAMGETGTDVAREAGDIVLMDDNFTTIVHAIEEGRLIYENLKKGVRYYLSCKLALVMINLLPTLLLVPVPFAPVQIILMELFMDLLAAASFSTEAAESDLLDQKPRDPKAKFMDKPMIRSLLTSSFGLFAAVTAIYLITWYSTKDVATSQTVAFFGWLVGHVLLAFNMRSERQPIYQMGLGSNRLMLIWAGAVAAFLIGISTIPGAQQLMKTTTLSASQWAMIVGATFIGTFWLELKKLITYKKGKGKNRS